MNIQEVIDAINDEWIKKLEQIRAEITAEALSHSGTGEEVIQAYVDGLNHSIRMLDKALKEQSK